ncbi:zinc finger protein Gfi-1b [Biomphalaria glabrata]|nr:zinc finger protein Gfi-1b-like; partial [Biomphalaria glabrata]
MSLGHQKSITNQELGMTHFTETNKLMSLASRLLAVSKKTNNRLYPVPIILPDFKLTDQTQGSEVSQLEVIIKEKEMTSETGVFDSNVQYQMDQNDSKETFSGKEIEISSSHQTKHKHQCQNGLKEFAEISNLKAHQDVHATKGPYKCQKCLKTFSKLQHLNDHHVIHTGEKPFKCQVCDKTFGRSSSFRKHRAIHFGEKHYKCQICLKEFLWSSDLKVHQRIHTGEKPFKCQICQKTFTTSSALKRHQVIHFGEKHFKC